MAHHDHPPPRAIRPHNDVTDMENNTHNDLQLSRWLKGIGYEVAFWNNVYRWKKTFSGMMGWSHYGKTIQLDTFDANGFLAQDDNPVVLDVGSGMSYAPGNFIEKDGRLQPLDIHYVDPLAFFFNRILKRHHRDMPQIEFGMMEYLSAFYEKDSTSMVIIQNALDHSANPLKGIYEALDTLRIGGVLYLNHHPNEAVVEGYKGFHQYNIIGQDGRLIIWNKDERHDVSQLLSPFATTEVTEGEDAHVVAIVRKTAEVPAHLLCDKADKHNLCEQMLMQAVDSFSLSANLTRYFRYWKFNTIQYVAQALPWDKKMKIKQLLKKNVLTKRK